MHRARPGGRLWLGRAHQRAADPESSNKETVRIYERFGLELRDTLEVADGPELWPMWRAG